MTKNSIQIRIGARDSLLSQKQVEEIYKEITLFHPTIEFEKHLVKTTGDLDLKTSLLEKEKSDFFTKEIDELVLNHHVDIGIHSAKDLPDPLPSGLKIFALTKGVDSSDSLVLREGHTLFSLPHQAKIGTSSKKRQAQIQQLREDFLCVDIRGTISNRLKLLEEMMIDGVVIAHAALIRLELLDLNWYPLKHETAPLQGRLAVIGRDNDSELFELFNKLHYEGL